MKTLAFDTSTKFLTVACFDGDKIKSSFHENAGITHSDILIPVIKSIAEELKWDIRGIDLICVGLGPGSFTGLRIAMAAVKGITSGIKSKVIGVPTMDAIVRNVPGKNGLIAPLLDAHKGKVYTCVYKKESEKIERKTEYLLIKAEEFLSKLKEEVFFFGSGIEKYKTELDSCGLAQYNENIDWFPRAVEIGRVGMTMARDKTDDPKTLEPLYLNAKEANITENKRM